MPEASAQEATAELELVGVSRYHGDGGTRVVALRSVSLALGRGELVAVVGESGSGKTTLLAVAGGLDYASEGRVFIGGRDLSALTADEVALLRRRRVGYVFQDFNLVPGLTAGENVSLPLELDGHALGSCRGQALAGLTRVGLAGLEGRFPSQLSGGQQQRVAIARALIGERRLLLADEPTGALDRKSGDLILRLIREQCDAGAACLLVTHNERHVGWADRLIRMSDGVAAPPVGGRRPVVEADAD